MEPETVSQGAFRAVGIRLDDGGRLSACILYAWIALASRRDQVSGMVNPSIVYGMWLHDKPEPAYFAGFEVSVGAPVPEGMVAIDVPAGSYALFRHHGHVGRIGETYSRADRWFEEAGAPHCTRPVLETYDTTQPITEDYEFTVSMPIGEAL